MGRIPRDRDETHHAGSTYDNSFWNRMQDEVISPYNDEKRGAFQLMIWAGAAHVVSGSNWTIDAAGGDYYLESGGATDIAFLPIELPPGAWFDKATVFAYGDSTFSPSLLVHELDALLGFPASVSPGPVRTLGVTDTWTSVELYATALSKPLRLTTHVAIGCSFISIGVDDRVAGVLVDYRMDDGWL